MIAADEANVIPAEAKATPALEADQICGAKMSPIEVGIALWKTIAPVMLPMARVSLPWRTQITLFSFSGNSVAIGAMIKARSVPFRPSERASPWTEVTETTAPPIRQTRAHDTS